MSLPPPDRPVPASPLARWDARWKLAAFLLLAAAVPLLNRAAPAAAALTLALGVALLGRVPLSALFARLALLGLSALPLAAGPWLAPSPTAWPDLGVLLVRLAALGVLTLTLTRTTRPAELFAAAGCLGAPSRLVEIARLAVRYQQTLAAEARRQRGAMRARGFRLRTTRHAYRTLGAAVGSMLARSEERAGRVQAALLARGYAGAVPLLTPFRTTRADRLSFLAALAATISLVLWDRVVP